MAYAKNCGYDLMDPEHGVTRADLALQRLDPPASLNISEPISSSVDQIGVGFCRLAQRADPLQWIRS